jgi:hypothetical protein
MKETMNPSEKQHLRMDWIALAIAALAKRDCFSFAGEAGA